MGMAVIGIPCVPWDYHRNEKGNGNECDGNWITIFTITFPFQSLHLQ